MDQLEIPEGFEEQKWRSLVRRGRRDMRTKGMANFSLGDTALEISQTDGYDEQRVRSVTKLWARQINCPYEQLVTYRRVAAAWSPEHRREDVCWTVHQTLAPQPNRFELLAKEPSDDLDVEGLGRWHTDAASRARQNLPGSPSGTEERIEHVKHMLRKTPEAAAALNALSDRPDVIEAALEYPTFRRAYREASVARGSRLAQQAETVAPEPRLAPDTPASKGTAEGHTASEEESPPLADVRTTPSSVLRAIGLSTNFAVAMQRAVIDLRDEMLTTEDEAALTESIRRVRAVCDWCEHVVTTGQTDMDEGLARLLGSQDER
ncbi:DUF6192 family protein [Streptomyces sp. NRRL F-5126]|uniref:DUF6192 family protein n=1 Tax=Streptomyces sp. NRRL F-5126 TaxID=1463857 RepID=UPI000560CD7E|nr:DUF6192 family protein [Streptomyces sp. NRRL F-5126]